MSKFVDMNVREVVEFVMGIGERKLGRMIHCVATPAPMRDVTCRLEREKKKKRNNLWFLSFPTTRTRPSTMLLSSVYIDLY